MIGSIVRVTIGSAFVWALLTACFVVGQTKHVWSDCHEGRSLGACDLIEEVLAGDSDNGALDRLVFELARP